MRLLSALSSGLVRKEVLLNNSSCLPQNFYNQAIKMASKIRTNFHATSEAMINKQINMELHASYVYMSMVRSVYSV